MFYKETDFEETSIGKIPIGWNVEKIGDVCNVVTGGTPSTKHAEYFGGNVKWLKSGDIKKVYIYDTEEKITQLGVENSNAKIHPPNSVAIALSGRGQTRGKTAVIREPMACSQSVAIMVPMSELLPEYLHYNLSNRYLEIRNLTGNLDRSGLNLSIVSDIKIPLPALDEQKRITEVLGVVDSAVELADKVIAKTERLKKGLMQKLLTEGIGHKEFKDTEIGKIPKTWEVRKLGEVLELCQYGLSSRFGDQGKYPIVKMDDIVNGVVVPDNVKYLDLNERTFDNFRLERGDVLFNRTNSLELVGRTGIFLLDGDYVFASYLIRLRPKRGTIDSLYLTYYMIFSNERLKQLATRAVHQANINATNLQSFKIPVPPSAEQQRIAETLSCLDSKLEFEEKQRAKLERIKQGLMDLFLTGKVRVRMD
jgi:type I restriction enzyme S subunit